MRTGAAPVVGNLAWQTVIGTLGGVTVTALFSLLTAYSTHRWQHQRSRAENRLALDRELRAIRRQTYAKYVSSAQDVFQIASRHYAENRHQPIDSADVAMSPPDDLRAAIMANESLRVEVVLLAGPAVRSAVRTYGLTLKELWPVATSGTEFSPQASTSAYHHLIDTMHAEITSG